MNPEENFDLDEILKEAKERDVRFRQMEDHGSKEIVKYFDRIHDKLFDLNNILIAAYLALVAFKNQVPKAIIFIPLLNLVFLIYVEWRMMEKSRLESQITQLSKEKIDKYGRMIAKTNLYSLALIITTVIVTAVFVLFIY